MKPFQRGQLWLVNFEPSIGHEYRKVRPALIIQQDQYIVSGMLLTVIPLSTQLHKARELDVHIAKDEKNRLFQDSLAKITQISSFDRRRFLKFIGVLNNDIMGLIDTNVQQFLLGTAGGQVKE
jgi:mRNA interferase MazF